MGTDQIARCMLCHSVLDSVWPLFSEDKRPCLAASTVDLMVCVRFRLQSTQLIQSKINRLPFFCKLFLNLLHVGCKIDFCFLEINTEKRKKKSNDKIHRSIRTNKAKCSFIFLSQRSKSRYSSQIVKKALRNRMFIFSQHSLGKCSGELQGPPYTIFYSLFTVSRISWEC